MWSHWMCGYVCCRGCAAVHDIMDPVEVQAQLGVDASISWVFASIFEPLHALQQAITHHHAAAIILQWGAERGWGGGRLD